MASTIESDIYGMIKDIIQEETLYLRHYVGKIVDNNDPLKKGRLKITLPYLGMDTPDLALWCNARQGNGMTIPSIGKYAEVYFINADRTKPVYLFPASEIKGNIPTGYDGKIKTNVIYQDAANSENKIIQNEDGTTEIKFKGKITLQSEEGVDITAGGTLEFAPLTSKIKLIVDNQIMAIYNAHTHTGNLGAPTTPPLTLMVVQPDAQYASTEVKIS